MEEQLEQMSSAAGDLISPCKYASSFKLYGDLRDRARREQHLFYYALGTFYQMDQAQYLLDFVTMRERAIELISLLESEEQSRKIQPDVALPIFEHLVYTMSACAYENLAEATGQMDGYNSEGMQACIAEGLQICRQTGKLPCIGCFREYSCDVYMSADDAEIARHQCTLVLDQTMPVSDRGDRRWLAKKKVAWMTCLEGRVEEAIDLLRDALKLTEDEQVTIKLESQTKTLFDLDALLILSGRPTEMTAHPIFAQLPPRDECPLFDFLGDLNKALQATVDGEYEKAAELLTHWDRHLQERKASHLWFETRLRLIAVKHLWGDQLQAERLAKQLEKRATATSDYLTLRRLAAIQDPDLPTSPLGIFGRRGSPTPARTPAQVVEEKAAAREQSLQQRGGPLKARIEEIGEQMMEIDPAEVDTGMAAIRSELMSIALSEVVDADDASALMHLMGFVLGDCAQGEEIWAWANKIAANFQQHGTALSLLANLGDRLRFGDNPAFAQTITAERLEPLFRKAMELDNTRPRIFMRAGDHYLAEENLGEAERCYARAFRLARDEGEIALRLANLYRDTDRPRDALHVLDVCLREGNEHPAVPWEAALHAFGLERYEAMLTYLDRFEEDSGTRPWLNYYRAIGLLEQGDAAGAAEAIEEEEEAIEEEAFHTIAIKACTSAKTGDAEGARKLFERVLDTKLSSVDYLNPQGVGGTLARCLEAAAEDLQDQALAARFDDRLLQVGMAREEMLAAARTGKPSEVTLFRCLIDQPLDDRWKQFAGCLVGQTEWDAYLAEWGVLAENEEAAGRMVLDWQAKCYPLTAEIAGIQSSDQVFEDSPGVVYQGVRFCPSEMEDDEDEL